MDLKQTLKRGFFALFTFSIFLPSLAVAVPLSLDEAKDNASSSNWEYYVKTFETTAYYTPLPDQDYYYLGSYEDDAYMNGAGDITIAADGTKVYPGMVACPHKRTYDDGSTAGYDFGTKFTIPGVGTVTCHDRGGAIRIQGERGNTHDRLDIWMGFGDEGLTRALQWGRRTVDVLVYGVNPEIQDEVYLEGYTAAEAFIQNTVLAPMAFPDDLFYGNRSDDVSRMQQYLKDWGYELEVSGFYGADTAKAIYQFQLDYSIVRTFDELGAGHFGIQTRTMFDQLLEGEGPDPESVKLKKGESLLKENPDLYEEKTSFAAGVGLGESGETVRVLQEQLTALGFYRAEITGYYGAVTENAVFKFQQSQGIVETIDDLGAGYFGPVTRANMNAILQDRYDFKSLIAYQREEVSEGRHLVEVPGDVVAIVKDEEPLQ